MSGSGRSVSRIFAIVIVCAFLSISAASSIVHSNTGSNTESVYDMHSGTFVASNNNSFYPGCVKYTLDLLNNTLIKGNFFNIRFEHIDPVEISYDSSNGYIYVTNAGCNDVSVINGRNNTVVDTIMVGAGPYAILFDPSNGFLYVTNGGSASVSVINPSSNTVIDTICVESGPSGASYDSNNGYLYVANFVSNNVSVINLASNSVINTIGVGIHPLGMSFDPTNGYLYVANCQSGTISVISTATPPSKTPLSGTSNLENYGIVGAIITIVAIGSGIALIRKRK